MDEGLEGLHGKISDLIFEVKGKPDQVGAASVNLSCLLLLLFIDLKRASVLVLVDSFSILDPLTYTFRAAHGKLDHHTIERAKCLLKHYLLYYLPLRLSELTKCPLVVEIMLLPIVDELLKFFIHRECLLNSIEPHPL